MGSIRRNLRANTLIPSAFLGSPVALLLPAALMHVMPLWLACAVGAVAGLAAGRTLLAALAQG